MISTLEAEFNLVAVVDPLEAQNVTPATAAKASTSAQTAESNIEKEQKIEIVLGRTTSVAAS
jgi:hypothetical protein